MINCNTGRRTAISDRMKLHDSKKCLCVIMIQMGLFQFIPCVASMLFYVACGNGLARRIMTAKGGFCHVKRKHQDIKKSKGLSQEELAVKLNVVRQTISKWEQGLSVPDSELLLALSEALETPVSTLLGETVSEPETDDLKSISQKLEVINLQLSKRQQSRRKIRSYLLYGRRGS